MSRRLPILIAAAALLSAACTGPPDPKVDFPEGVSFVPQVADSIDDVGLGNDIAVDPDGRPFVSYFGFEAVLEEGEIPVTRPVGAAFLPAAQVASLASEGYWIRGAVAQAEDFPAVNVPFGPTLVESLSTLEPDNSNGTSIAVGGDGSPHVAWAANDGIWYASSGVSSSAEQVSRYGGTLNVAGPIGRPGIAVDGVTPWVAWTVENGSGHEVHVATPRGERWRDEVVATISCAQCPPPLFTEVGITPEGPIVLYVDPAAQAVLAARRVSAGWVSETVASGIAGLGLSMAVGVDGAIYAAYYTGKGTVELATNDGGGWTTGEVAEAGSVAAENGNFAQTTGLAVEDDGTVYVSWHDEAEGAVRLASSADGGFKRIETVGTQGGSYPSLAVAADGSSVYLAWYDTSTEDLLVGIFGEVGELLVVQPSPGAEPPSLACEPTEPQLSVVAQGTAFDTGCLAAIANEPFQIDFDDRDDASAIGQHNVAIYVDEQSAGQAADALFVGDLVSGPDQVTYDVDPIDAGEYYFRCDVHPIMNGTFVAIAG